MIHRIPSSAEVLWWWWFQDTAQRVFTQTRDYAWLSARLVAVWIYYSNNSLSTTCLATFLQGALNRSWVCYMTYIFWLLLRKAQEPAANPFFWIPLNGIPLMFSITCYFNLHHLVIKSWLYNWDSVNWLEAPSRKYICKNSTPILLGWTVPECSNSCYLLNCSIILTRYWKHSNSRTKTSIIEFPILLRDLMTSDMEDLDYFRLK